MSPVESSWIESAGYDRDKSTLHVKIGGVTYTYPKTAPAMWEKFQKAKSKGRFFGKHFRFERFKKLKATKK